MLTNDRVVNRLDATRTAIKNSRLYICRNMLSDPGFESLVGLSYIVSLTLAFETTELPWRQSKAFLANDEKTGLVLNTTQRSRLKI